MSGFLRAAQLGLDEVNRVFSAISRRLLLSYGDPTLIVSGSYEARLGDLVIVKPGIGGASVKLPSFRRADIGKSITVVNASDSTRAITVSAIGGLVNGAQSVETTSEYSVRQAVAVDFTSQLWLLTTVAEGTSGVPAGANDPIWEWNGADLTQFDSLIEGSSISSSSASVASVYGTNWIVITAINSSTVPSYDQIAGVYLPISETFGTSDYRIHCEAHRVSSGAAYSAGCFARSETGASGPTGCFMDFDSTSGRVEVSPDGTTYYERRAISSSGWTNWTIGSGSHYINLNDIELEVSGENIIYGGDRQRRGGVVEDSVLGLPTAEGDKGIYVTAKGNGFTSVFRFRNIKVYEA